MRKTVPDIVLGLFTNLYFFVAGQAAAAAAALNASISLKMPWLAGGSFDPSAVCPDGQLVPQRMAGESTRLHVTRAAY